MTETSNTVHVGSVTPHATEARFVSIESDVRGLKSDIGEIKTGVKDLGGMISSKSQTNWAALSVYVVVALAFLGWSWAQFSGLQGRLETATTSLAERLEKSTAGFVDRADIKDKFEAAEKLAELKAQVTAVKTDRTAADLTELQSKVVPLQIHKELWDRQREVNRELSDLIKENRQRLDDLAREPARPARRD